MKSCPKLDRQTVFREGSILLIFQLGISPKFCTTLKILPITKLWINLSTTAFMLGLWSKTPHLSNYFKLKLGFFKLNPGMQLWCFISTAFNSTIHSNFELNFEFGQHESCSLMLGLYFSYWRFHLVLACFWFTELWILGTFTEKLNFQFSSDWLIFNWIFLHIFP